MIWSGLIRALSVAGLDQHRSYRRYRKKHSQCVGLEGHEAVALIKLLATGCQVWVSVIKNVEHDNGDPKIFGRECDAAQRVGKQVASIAMTGMPLINADHGNVGGRDRSMARTGPCISLRQFLIVDRMGVDRIETDDLASYANHDIDAEISCLRQLVRGLLEEIIDLLDTTGKNRPIMFFRIERLYG